MTWERAKFVSKKSPFKNNSFSRVVETKQKKKIMLAVSSHQLENIKRNYHIQNSNDIALRLEPQDYQSWLLYLILLWLKGSPLHPIHYLPPKWLLSFFYPCLINDCFQRTLQQYLTPRWFRSLLCVTLLPCLLA